MSTYGLTPAARESFAALLVALDDLEDRGLIPPCRNPQRAHLWTSEDPAEREAAAHMCASCPVLDACTAHAPHERFGAWGATDRTPRTTNKENPE